MNVQDAAIIMRDLFLKWISILDACNELRLESKNFRLLSFASKIVDSASVEYELAMRNITNTIKDDASRVASIEDKVLKREKNEYLPDPDDEGVIVAPLDYYLDDQPEWAKEMAARHVVQIFAFNNKKYVELDAWDKAIDEITDLLEEKEKRDGIQKMG